MHYVYILRGADGTIYIGYSADLKRRLQEHLHKGVATTKNYTEPKLVWYCAFVNKKDALEFERYLKAGSGHAFARKHLIKQ